MLGVSCCNIFIFTYAVLQGYANPSFFMVVAALSMTVSNLASGRLLRALGHRTLLSIAMVLSGALIALIALVPCQATFYLGGIGFGMKWNMGWMHDTLEYLHEEPINRKWHHNEITFSMVYAYSEHYVLPISHDEVVYGKGSLYGKMPGDDWQKLAGVRSMFAYQWAHPGKKLSFMGNELAQWGEWDHDASIDWDCLNWQEHRQVQTMVADLNAFYKAHPALWSQDFDPAGFQWLTSDDADHNTLSFLRIGTKGETLAVVVNFSGEAWSDYQVALPTGGKWTEVFTTDDAKYGGSDIHNGTFEAVEGEYHSRPFSAKITVPALGVVFLKPED